MYHRLSSKSKSYCLDNYDSYKKCGFDSVFCGLCRDHQNVKSKQDLKNLTERINNYCESLQK